MKKQILFIFSIILLIGIVSAGTMTLTGPSSATTGSTFQITYTASASGTWGASLTSSVSGNCLFPSGSSSYQSVMLSSDGNTKSITITAPSSASTCIITGDSKFGTDNVNPFNSLSITIGSGGTTCTPTTCGSNCGTPSNGCGGTLSCGTCSGGTTTNPFNLDFLNQVATTLFGFEITWMYIIIGVVAVILLIVLLK